LTVESKPRNSDDYARIRIKSCGITVDYKPCERSIDVFILGPESSNDQYKITDPRLASKANSARKQRRATLERIANSNNVVFDTDNQCFNQRLFMLSEPKQVFGVINNLLNAYTEFKSIYCK